VTALHKDNYENIYVQAIGKKHFVLLPPVEAACINEQTLPAATYHSKLADPETTGDLEVQLDDPAETVPFATWDPDVPEKRPTAFSRLSKPLKVTLDVGDMLYLPALWYHKVSQSCSEEGICVAVNYWYANLYQQSSTHLLISTGTIWSLAGHFGHCARLVGVLGC
jgi:peptidyl-lysine (3S)-dioxygenase / protease